MDSFFAMDVQRAAIQTMETLYILATSKNIDTIKSRYDFLLTVIPTLKSAKNDPHYAILIKGALDQFKSMYPAGTPQNYQLAVLNNPDSFDPNEFYCNSLVHAIKRFCDKQTEEIKALKKEAARTKRISKVIDTIKTTQSELEAKCSSAQSFHTALSEIKTLSTSFEPQHEKVSL
jgi:hypothetical protein